MPDSDIAQRLPRLRQRAQILIALRQFFASRDFVEVDTPVAIRAPAPERYVEAPAVHLNIPSGRQTRFLQTSPELSMKRLVAAGLPRIYQLAVVFRDGDLSPQHRPEFRLLEWYRAHSPWTALLDDCEALLWTCAQAAGAARPALAPPYPRLSVEEAWQRWTGRSLLAHLEHDELRRQVLALGLRPADDDSWDDLFHRVWLARIEPQLARLERPIFITDFPAPLASLAQLNPADPRRAERFELYAGGLELANGFGELTCPVTQRQRFVAERAARAAAGRCDYPLDEGFLLALEELPPTAGIALGFDRLLMLLLEADDIDDIAWIPWNNL